MDAGPAAAPGRAARLGSSARGRRGPRGPRAHRQLMQGAVAAAVCRAPPAAGQAEADIVRQLRGHVVEYSKTAEGCRRVQDVLKQVQKRDQKALVQELKGHVCELLESPHGNHVLQLSVELLPPEAVDFVCHELLQRWRPARLAQQPYGCRILERLIEHFPTNRLAGAYADILGKVEALSDDQYGNFVIQHLLEHGTEDHRRQISEAVRGNVAHFVNSSFACGVLDKVLTYGSSQDQLRITSRILEQEPFLASMAINPHGFASTQRVFKVAATGGGGMLEIACKQLLSQPTFGKIKASRHGLSLLHEVIPPEHRRLLAGGPLQAQPGARRSHD